MSEVIAGVLQTLGAVLGWICMFFAWLLMKGALLYWQWIQLLSSGGDYALHTLESAHPTLTFLIVAYFPFFVFMAFAPIFVLLGVVSHFVPERTPKKIAVGDYHDSGDPPLSPSQMTALDAVSRYLQ